MSKYIKVDFEYAGIMYKSKETENFFCRINHDYYLNMTTKNLHSLGVHIEHLQNTGEKILDNLFLLDLKYSLSPEDKDIINYKKKKKERVEIKSKIVFIGDYTLNLNNTTSIGFVDEILYVNDKNTGNLITREDFDNIREAFISIIY